MTEQPPITAVVPFLPVRDVEQSAAFYKVLGFEIGNRVPHEGRMGWAWLYMPKASDWRRGANLMLSRTGHVGDMNVAGMMFYLYVADLVGLRNKLLEAGLAPGPISYPFYLPKGECELRDPDGHVLMLAQSDANTP